MECNRFLNHTFALCVCAHSTLAVRVNSDTIEFFVVGGGDGDADGNPEGNASGGDDVHGSGGSPVSDTLDIDGAIEQAHEQDVGPEVLKILILTKQERDF